METSVFHWYKFKGGLPIQKTSKQTLRISNVLEHLKSTKITMDDVYQKLLVVMKHGYIILNRIGKLVTIGPSFKSCIFCITFPEFSKSVANRVNQFFHNLAVQVINIGILHLYLNLNTSY